jgi:serine/threonine protein kinase
VSAGAEDGRGSRLGELLGGRYRVLELLGAGGMGSVFRAVDEQTHVPVAVKVLADALPDEHASEARFRQEISASKLFSHPNLVATLDSGEADDGTPFFVMELVEGPSLFALVRSEGRLAPARALELVRGVVTGLEHMHAHGAIHRDIKPANIMVDQHGGREVAKILDFGVIKATEGHALTVLALTQAGTVMGSVSYMPPERLTGADFDHRSDLYAAGCVLFELLTGRPPYVGELPAETIGMHINAEIPWVAERGVAIPEGLEDLVRQMLAKVPSERPASATEVRLRLERLRPLVRAAPTSQSRALVGDDASLQAEPTAFLTPAEQRAAIQAQPTMLISADRLPALAAAPAPPSTARAGTFLLIVAAAVAASALAALLLLN